MPAPLYQHGRPGMSDAPERIWADYNQEWDSGSWGLDKDFDNDVEYLRSDLIAAARREGYERGLREAGAIVGLMVCQSNDGTAGRLGQAAYDAIHNLIGESK
jgi:hypothetical protein